MVQSDPDLPGSSGERVLSGKSGCPVNRGPTAVVIYDAAFLWLEEILLTLMPVTVMVRSVVRKS